MKIFIYKTFLIFGLIIITFYLTFGFLKKELKREFVNVLSKENINLIKTKIKNELKEGLKKEKLLKKDDAILIKNYIEKIKIELNQD